MDAPTDPMRDASDVDMDEEEQEAAAMAAAMGFSGFGKAQTAKKRKYNPKTDAFVSGQDLEAIDRGGKRGQGSGGNQIPLGKMRVLGTKAEPSAQNKEEIDLDEDEDDASEPAYIDTSLSPPDAAAQEVQAKINVILADTSSAVEPPKRKQKQKPAQPQGLGAYMAALKAPVVPPTSIPPAPGTVPAASPIPPAPGTAGSNMSLPQRPPQASVPPSHNGSVRGQRNELWYVDYYDPGFNENPWEHLEKKLGLPSVGTWLERKPRTSQKA